MSLVNVNPFETENKPVIILELGIYDQFQFAVMDYKTGKIKSATNTAIKKLTHHIDLSNVIKNAESLADFISMMRIELTFAILQEQVNLHTYGSSEVTISHLEGICLGIKNSLEDYLSEDKEQFLDFKDATKANQQPIKIIYS